MVKTVKNRNADGYGKVMVEEGEWINDTLETSNNVQYYDPVATDNDS